MEHALREENPKERIEEVILYNPDKFEQAKEKPALRGWFIGQVMKVTYGKFDPYVVQKIVEERFNASKVESNPNAKLV